MKPFTREEEACFKTALALVVVKKRLLEQQQHDLGEKKDDETNGASSKRHGAKNKDDAQDKHGTKRVRTMDSLMFPWSHNADVQKAATSSMAAAAAAAAAVTPQQHPYTMTSTTKARPNLLTQQRSQQHKAHVQTMMATALRIAMRLVANDDNNNNNNSLSLWTSLAGLTTHLAHQLSLSMSLAQNVSTTALMTATGGGSAGADWVKEWAWENLQQQLAQTASMAQDASSSFSPSGMIQATFLVWRGILMGQENANSNNMMTAKTTAKTAATKKGSSSASHRAACRTLFVEVFCDVLQKEGILVEQEATRDTALGSRGVARSNGTTRVANVLGGRQQKPFSTSVSGKASVSQKRAIAPPPSQTSDRGSSVRPSPRPRHAWQRVFSAARTVPRHRHHRRHFRGGSHAGTTDDAYLFNLWLVHGLQLLQQVMAVTNHGKVNHGEVQRPSIFHRLHPELFLPPVHMTQWYVDTVDRRLEQLLAVGGMQKTTDGGAATIGLDPGAKLMSMVALCQALKDEHQTQTVSAQRVH